MRRGLVLVLVVAAAVVGLALVWNTVRRDRQFHQLIAQGDASMAEDETFRAIESFSGALALKADSMLAHLKRGDAYRRHGELAAALRDLREAADLEPSATRPRELLGDVNVAMARYERSIEDYRSYLAIDDRSPRVLYKLALAHFQNGQATQALDPLRQAIKMDNRFVEAYYLLGMCLRPTEPVEALRSLTRAVDLNPAFAAAREELADVLTTLGRPREGVEQLEALAAREPARAERAVTIGLAYARLGRTDTAILKLGRATEQYPDDPLVYTALGRIWLEIAESRHDAVALSKAVGALQAAAGPSTSTSEALALYGRALYLSGDATGAQRWLERATTRLPVEPLAFLYLSAAAERLGRIPVSRDALIDYVGLAAEDDHASAYAGQIADLSLRMNDASTAVTWARRAVQGTAADVVPLGLLADALWRTGRRDESREILARALQRDPGNRALLRLKQRFAAS